jgi:hypothetical protein
MIMYLQKQLGSQTLPDEAVPNEPMIRYRTIVPGLPREMPRLTKCGLIGGTTGTELFDVIFNFW